MRLSDRGLGVWHSQYVRRSGRECEPHRPELARIPVTPPSLKTIGWICSQVALATRHSRTGCFISRVALLGGRMNSTFFNPGGANVFDTNRTRTGWTVGVGSEWKFGPNWSAFVEYNHADFGTNGGTCNCVLGPVALNAKSNADLVLFGVNWRPSVARLLKTRLVPEEPQRAVNGTGLVGTALSLGGYFVGKGKAPAPIVRASHPRTYKGNSDCVSLRVP